MLKKDISKAISQLTTENDFGQDVDVFSRIKELISERNLESGDKLPSERRLSEKIGVTRSQVRSAIQKLEFYGIIKTMPQSGSVVTGIGVSAISNIMKDVLELDVQDFKALVETRIIIETNAVRMAAERRSENDLADLEVAHSEFCERMLNGEKAIVEDLNFHLKISKSSGNSVLYSLMKVITPDIIAHFNKEKVCDRSQATKYISEHTAIFNAVRDQKAEEAVKALEIHFRTLRNYLKN